MILNNIQKEKLLKLFEDLKNYEKDLLQDIDPLPLIQEIFLNFESYEDLKHVKYDLKQKFLNCIDLDNEHFFYYSDAIDYLKEEDWSLRESLTLAKEFYTAKEFDNITSTTLANLLYNQKKIEKIEHNIDFDLIIETIIKNQ
jgi:hypothetical protein